MQLQIWDYNNLEENDYSTVVLLAEAEVAGLFVEEYGLGLFEVRQSYLRYSPAQYTILTSKSSGALMGSRHFIYSENRNTAIQHLKEFKDLVTV